MSWKIQIKSNTQRPCFLLLKLKIIPAFSVLSNVSLSENSILPFIEETIYYVAMRMRLATYTEGLGES